MSSKSAKGATALPASIVNPWKLDESDFRYINSLETQTEMWTSVGLKVINTTKQLTDAIVEQLKEARMEIKQTNSKSRFLETLSYHQDRFVEEALCISDDKVPLYTKLQRVETILTSLSNLHNSIRSPNRSSSTLKTKINGIRNRMKDVKSTADPAVAAASALVRYYKQVSIGALGSTAGAEKLAVEEKESTDEMVAARKKAEKRTVKEKVIKTKATPTTEEDEQEDDGEGSDQHALQHDKANSEVEGQEEGTKQAMEELAAKEGLFWKRGMPITQEVEEAIQKCGMNKRFLYAVGTAFNLFVYSHDWDLAALAADRSRALYGKVIGVPIGADAGGWILQGLYEDGYFPANILERHMDRAYIDYRLVEDFRPRYKEIIGLGWRVPSNISKSSSSSATVNDLVPYTQGVGFGDKRIRIFRHKSGSDDRTLTSIRRLAVVPDGEVLFRGINMGATPEQLQGMTGGPGRNVLGPGLYTTPDLDLAISHAVGSSGRGNGAVMIWVNVDKEGLKQIKYTENDGVWKGLVRGIAHQDASFATQRNRNKFAEAQVVIAPYCENYSAVLNDKTLVPTVSPDETVKHMFRHGTTERLRAAFWGIIFLEAK